jgi:hypothetical protein
LRQEYKAKKFVTKERKKILFISFTLLWIIWFPLFQYITELSSARLRRGPSGKSIKTIGFFEPGGYIDFRVKTDTSSINGYYKGTIEIAPVLAKVFEQKVVSWPPLKNEIGLSWGTKVRLNRTNSEKKIAFSVSFDIPNDPSLAGKAIPLEIRADLDYPALTGQIRTFEDRRLKIGETINILIGKDVGEPLSVINSFFNKRRYKHGFVMLAWLFGFIGCVALSRWQKKK